MLVHGLDAGKLACLQSKVIELLEVFRTVERRRLNVAVSNAAIRLAKGLREFIHHHSAVFSVGDLAHKRGNHSVPQSLTSEAKRLLARLHLSDEFGVGSLGFDQCRDAHLVA
ncbi:MAG: Uncharacterised protein [Cyanobium sp. ARS6]|nr:MAG: Uncharacterised protein [Cyanobium sp. ARS6]